MGASSTQMAPSSPKQTLNTLTLCRVPGTRENLWARERQGSRLEDRFIAPAKCFSLSPRLLRPSPRVRRRAESSRVTLADHCAIPAIYEDQSSTSNAVRTAAARSRIGDRAGASPTCRGRPVSSLVVDMGAPPSCRAALIQAADRLTLELNCQGEDVKSYRRSERDGGKA
jgi:hypothetical protein